MGDRRLRLTGRGGSKESLKIRSKEGRENSDWVQGSEYVRGDNSLQNKKKNKTMGQKKGNLVPFSIDKGKDYSLLVDQEE